MANNLRYLAAAALIGLGATVAITQTMAQTLSALRGPTPIDQAVPADPLTPEQNTSEREPRNYPEQPPLIPHSIEGYEVSIHGNKCLSCHARSRVGESQAPMISITHFADRDGQFRASVSPRRYFCTECHVPQHDVQVPVKNDFVDIDTLLRSATSDQKR
jgi:nitrate reductase (cytochrome), electron transfer subunit